MPYSNNEKHLEALLFVGGEPLSAKELASCIGMTPAAVRQVLELMKQKYIGENRGIQLVEMDDKYQLATNPDCSSYITRLLAVPAVKSLNPPLIETLAIIAYKQPITKASIEEIRGVDAGHAVNRLIELGLVCEVGRQKSPGRPLLFGTTDEFMRHYGIKDRKELSQEQAELLFENILEDDAEKNTEQNTEHNTEEETEE